MGFSHTCFWKWTLCSAKKWHCGIARTVQCCITTLVQGFHIKMCEGALPYCQALTDSKKDFWCIGSCWFVVRKLYDKTLFQLDHPKRQLLDLDQKFLETFLLRSNELVLSYFKKYEWIWTTFCLEADLLRWHVTSHQSMEIGHVLPGVKTLRSVDDYWPLDSSLTDILCLLDKMCILEISWSSCVTLSCWYMYNRDCLMLQCNRGVVTVKNDY